MVRDGEGGMWRAVEAVGSRAGFPLVDVHSDGIAAMSAIPALSAIPATSVTPAISATSVTPAISATAMADDRLPEVVESTKCSHFKKKETVVV